jgi:hypothetical protein
MRWLSLLLLGSSGLACATTSADVPTNEGQDEARGEPQSTLDPAPEELRALHILTQTITVCENKKKRRDDGCDDKYIRVGTLAWREAFARAGLVGVEDANAPHDVVMRISWEPSGDHEFTYKVTMTSAQGEDLATASTAMRFGRHLKQPAPGREQVKSSLRYFYDIEYDGAVRIVDQLVRSPKLLALAAAKRAPSAAKPASDTKPGAIKRSQGSVLVVFDIEDSARHFDAGTTGQLTEYLVARIAEVGGYRVVPRDQLRERLTSEKAESYRACIDQSCQIELGKALAAEKSLATKLLRIGDACAMTATLYDLRTETTERAASTRTECGASALLGGVDQIVTQLRPQ